MANKIMHHVVIGSDTFEIVDQYAREHGVTIDSTLAQSGQAADAKSVGDALTALDDRITAIGFEIVVDSNGNATIVRSDMVNTEEVSY
jgi:hypothetical protein